MRLDYHTRQHVRRQISEIRRKQLEASRRTEAHAYCGKCGIEKGDYSPGCTACSDRKRRSQHTVPCLNCGTPIKRYTMWRRASRGWPSASVQQCRECLRGKCKGCGVDVSQRTPKCDQCRYRAAKRLKKHRGLEASHG